ncbi:MAG: Clp protease N-terminal domain-containing protein, partial [Spirochaetales bacterium]|nr:Clp protease N-terminal domain-containing protein [Spirochaetales bacterium]
MFHVVFNSENRTLRTVGKMFICVRRQSAKYQGLPGAGLSVDAREAIRRAGEDARRLGHLYVGTEHILLGILRLPECTGARVITALGGD